LRRQKKWAKELKSASGAPNAPASAVFLTLWVPDEMQIEASFCEASDRKEQKSVSLAKAAEENYAEYRRQKNRP